MGFMGRASGLAVVTALLVASPAAAGVPHVVQPGETLWSIAAANNFTTRALAAANGLPADARVVAGTTIQIPSEQEAATALVRSGQTPSPASTHAAVAPRPIGAYAVRPGDTLSE